MNIEERVADVLGDEWTDDIGTAKSNEFKNISEWAAHVAPVLVAELRITEETACRYTFKPSGASMVLTDLVDIKAARKMTGSNHVLAEVHRYVTAWERAE